MRFVKLLPGLILFLLLAMPVCAAPAEDISSLEFVADSQGLGALWPLFDKDLTYPCEYASGAWLRAEHPAGIGSLYLIFNQEYPCITISDSDTGKEVVVDMDNMLHKYVELEPLFGRVPWSITITFPSGNPILNELYLFTPGEVPDWVQKWKAPVEGQTDLVLFSAHGDDEQLFFSGLLPYYAGEQERQVQVVYMTSHRNAVTHRTHEMLNGLWAVGVDTYPVFGPFPDFRIDSLEGTIEEYGNRGISYEELLGFVVEQLRRFRPAVAVTHDTEGEYGHGMHRLYAKLLMDAVEASPDPASYPEQKYEPFDLPKAYLHLYPDNPIHMDWDIPLSRFGGLTAYQVSRDLGYPRHVSQYEDFLWFYSGADTAAEVKLYSPCEYGLYYSTVGLDTACNDFFENIPTEAVQTLSTPEETEPEALPTEPVQTEPLAQQSEEVAVSPGNQRIPGFSAMIFGVSVLNLVFLLIGKKFFEKM